MAVQSTKTRMETTATSGVTDYVVRHSNGDGTYSNIHVQNETDLDVYVDGVLKTLTTDYTVSIDSNQATVTFTSAPIAEAEIVVVRKLGLTQGTSYINNDIFDAATLEDALDKLTLQAQQLDESISRSIRFGDTVANAPDPTINIDASERAGKILGFSADGSQFVTSEFFGTYRGAWTDGEVYNTKDIVRTWGNPADHNYGSLWIAKQPHTADEASGFAPSNTDPLASNAYWELILDTGHFATQADLANTSAGLSESWAKKTDGIVNNTDYSAKAYAIGGTGVTNTANKGAAKEWATKTGGTVDGTDYSSKEYATGNAVPTGSAKAWANTPENTQVITGEYSALHYKVLAEAAKTDAITAKNDSEAARDLAQDWANKTNGTVDGTNYSAKHWASQGSVGTVATNINDINDVATGINNVATVANSINNVNTVATGIADINNYADTYHGSHDFTAGDPVGTFNAGDLIFDSGNNVVKVYNGTSWQNATSSVEGVIATQEYTGDNTTQYFAFTVDQGMELVYLNGVKMLRGSDYECTSSNASTTGVGDGGAASYIYFTTAPATGDVVSIVGFGQSDNTLAVPVSGGTFTGNVSVTGNFASKGIDDNASSTALTIDNAGRVGIGETLPIQKLEVAGNIRAKNSSYTRLELFNDSDSIDPNDYWITEHNNDGSLRLMRRDDSAGTWGSNLILEADGEVNLSNNKMRIDSSGHVIVPNGVTLGTAAGTYNAANTLDDYEEGTVTMTSFVATIGLTNVSHHSAYYTKVGNLVHIQGYANITCSGTGRKAFTMHVPTAIYMHANSNIGQLGVCTAYPNATNHSCGYILDNSGGDPYAVYVEFDVDNSSQTNLTYQMTYRTA